MSRGLRGRTSLCPRSSPGTSNIHKPSTSTTLPVRTVKKFPDKVMFYFQDEEWTFRRVEEYSNQVPGTGSWICLTPCPQIAHYFLTQGLSKGDTVAVFMENRSGLTSVIQVH